MRIGNAPTKGGASYSDGAHWKNDTFNAEGSDYPNLENRPGIPNHIYALIAEAVAEATGNMENEALVWISNL